MNVDLEERTTRQKREGGLKQDYRKSEDGNWELGPRA